MQAATNLYVEAIKKTQNELLRADVYCEVIKELFIYLGCEAFREDVLNCTLEDDIQMFIARQYSKLDKIMEKEIKSREFKN